MRRIDPARRPPSFACEPRAGTACPQSNLKNLFIIFLPYAISESVDRDEVITFRESGKIAAFLRALVARGGMTDLERRIVQQEGLEVYRHAGYLDRDGHTISASGDEDAAVERYANHQMKRKLIELHPELAGELAHFIERRPHHPLPPVPPALATPGDALAQYLALVAYIDEKRDRGIIGHDKAHAMYEPAITVFEDSGIDYGEPDERTDKAVLVQAHHLMKKKLLEIHPELADEVRNLGVSRRL